MADSEYLRGAVATGSTRGGAAYGSMAALPKGDYRRGASDGITAIDTASVDPRDVADAFAQAVADRKRAESATHDERIDAFAEAFNAAQGFAGDGRTRTGN